MYKHFLSLILFVIFYNTSVGQSFSAGHYQSFAVCTDHTVRAWGNNSFGCLGDGTTNDSYTPIPVLNLTNVRGVSASDDNSTYAVKYDGTVWAWGYNGFGELGTGNLAPSSVPVQVINLTNVIAVAGGGFHVLALKSDSTVWAWGYNAYGQLGDSTTTDRNIPVQVHGLTGIIAIAAGEDHNLALKSDGSMYAWGWNVVGQVGNGANNNVIIPVRISALTDTITAISAGWQHSLAIKKNGQVLGWGFNGYGELGTGNNNDANSPVLISAITDTAIAVAAGSVHSMILLKDSTVRTCGYGFSGQLGNGSTASSNVPVAVTGLNRVVAISAGWEFSSTLNDSGNEINWGGNGSGQLGNGNNADQTLPVPVIGLCSVFTAVHSQAPASSLFSAYPNPSGGLFTIKQELPGIMNLTVYNVMGELVYASPLVSTTTVDLRNEPQGIYFLRAQSGSGVLQQSKIIIQ